MSENEETGTTTAPAPVHVSRAKFTCNSVTQYSSTGEGSKRYEFGAVYDNGLPENKRFARYSPSGSISITVDNPAVKFEVGKSYYIDFTEAPQ